MRVTANGIVIKDMQQDVLPIRVVKSYEVENAEGLKEMRFQDLPPSVSFEESGWTCFNKSGSYVILDFGKEICGGIRMVVRRAKISLNGE